MVINKSKVLKSMWVPIPTVFLLMVLTGVLEGIMTTIGVDDIMEIFGAAFIMMLFGIVVWVPSIIICLIIEKLVINERTRKVELLGILIAEAFVPVLIFSIAAINVEPLILLPAIFIALLAQGCRWLYLVKTKRMFN